MKNLKILGWTTIVALLSFFFYFGYHYYLKPEPEPITIPKEERFFQDDGGSLTWLEDPAIKEDPSQADGGLVKEEGNKETELDKGTVTSPTNQVLPPDTNVDKTQANKENGETIQPIPSSSMESASTDPLMNIKQRYTVKFKQLERSYQGKLKSLIGQAKGEYAATKNGETEVSVMSLAAKYMKKAQQMEEQADAQFYSLLSEMEQELKAQGLSTELIKTAKMEYEQRKRNQRAALIHKFSSKM